MVQGFGILSEKKWKHFGINYPQSQILFEVSENPGIAAKSLSSYLQLDKSSISRHLKFLEEKGLISFVLHPHDHRKREIYLSGAGKKLIKKLDDFGNEKLEEMLEGISESEKSSLEKSLTIFRRDRKKGDLPSYEEKSPSTFLFNYKKLFNSRKSSSDR